MDNKTKDINAILDYIKGKDSVLVDDIIEKSGAEKLRVYPVLFELEQDKKIKVLDRTGLGAPTRIKLR